MLLSIIALTLFYLYLRRNYSYWERKGFKTLPGSVYMMGHLKATFLGKDSVGSVVKNVYNKTYDPFIGIYAMFRPVLLLRDPDRF